MSELASNYRKELAADRNRQKEDRFNNNSVSRNDSRIINPASYKNKRDNSEDQQPLELEKLYSHKRELEATRARESMDQQEIARDVKKLVTGPKLLAPLRTVGFARKMRKRAKQNITSTYLIALIIAIIADFADMTWFLGVLIKLFLFLFLLGKGTYKVRMTRSMMLVVDSIPVIGLAPISTLSVLYAWYNEKKESDRELKETNERIGDAEAA